MSKKTKNTETETETETEPETKKTKKKKVKKEKKAKKKTKKEVKEETVKAKKKVTEETSTRDYRGEKHHRAKLADKDIAMIRKKYKEGVSQAKLARHYNVSVTYMHKIVHRLARA